MSFYDDKKTADSMMWKHQEFKKKLEIKMVEWERLQGEDDS